MGCLNIQLGVCSSTGRFLDDEAYCSMVARNSFLPEVLNDMRRIMENACFTQVKFSKKKKTINP